jgi:hypothetical protein
MKTSNAPAIMRREKMCTHTYIMRTINILILRKNHYKIWLREIFLVPNTSKFLFITTKTRITTALMILNMFFLIHSLPFPFSLASKLLNYFLCSSSSAPLNIGLQFLASLDLHIPLVGPVWGLVKFDQPTDPTEVHLKVCYLFSLVTVRGIFPTANICRYSCK